MRRLLLATAVALALVPLAARATNPQSTLEALGHKVKPVDGNLWASRFRGGRLMRGQCARRCVALTFDDGPNWETTPRLLTTLAQQLVQVGRHHPLPRHAHGNRQLVHHMQQAQLPTREPGQGDGLLESPACRATAIYRNENVFVHGVSLQKMRVGV